MKQNLSQFVACASVFMFVDQMLEFLLIEFMFLVVVFLRVLGTA